jgi:hypothetical protein
LIGFFIIEFYSLANISKVENWLPKNFTVFATYYVAIYNKMFALVTSGSVRNTVIIQVVVRTEHFGSVKFSTDIENTLNLGKFFDKMLIWSFLII